MSRLRSALLWGLLAIVVVVSVIAAVMSPLLEFRSPVYISAGFAGVFGLVLLLFQPILAAGYLPVLSARRARHVHRWVGSLLVLSVIVHVAGLWITSPPDVIDALLFASPTPFSVWGVIAMWAVFAAACLALWRGKMGVSRWRWSHKTLVVVIVAGTVVHAMLIDGTMETISKAALCVLVIAATGLMLAGFKPGQKSATVA